MHRCFADEYLIDLNATQAYKRAGYKVSERVAAVNASKLLARPEVVAYIAKRQQELQKKTAITQEAVLEELRRIAFANTADFVQVVQGEHGCEVALRATNELPKEALSALASIKEGRCGIEVKLHDKVRALELLGRHLGLLVDKVEHSGKVSVTQEKLAAILEQLK